MGKRYIARYRGSFSLKCCVILCVAWIQKCGNCCLWGLAVVILINLHEDSGRSLDCCHEIWWHLLPMFLRSFCLVLSQAYLLERFSSVACCCTSPLPSKSSLVLCSFCLLFLFSQFLWLCLPSLSFFPSSVISLSLFCFQRSFFTIPPPNYKESNFSSNHFPP